MRIKYIKWMRDMRFTYLVSSKNEVNKRNAVIIRNQALLVLKVLVPMGIQLWRVRSIPVSSSSSLTSFVCWTMFVCFHSTFLCRPSAAMLLLLLLGSGRAGPSRLPRRWSQHGIAILRFCCSYSAHGLACYCYPRMCTRWPLPPFISIFLFILLQLPMRRNATQLAAVSSPRGSVLATSPFSRFTPRVLGTRFPKSVSRDQVCNS